MFKCSNDSLYLALTPSFSAFDFTSYYAVPTTDRSTFKTFFFFPHQKILHFFFLEKLPFSFGFRPIYRDLSHPRATSTFYTFCVSTHCVMLPIQTRHVVYSSVAIWLSLERHTLSHWEAKPLNGWLSSFSFRRSYCRFFSHNELSCHLTRCLLPCLNLLGIDTSGSILLMPRSVHCLSR